MTRRPRILAACVVATVSLVGCGPAQSGHAPVEPAHLESIDGTDLQRISLTERAVERLAIQTAVARREVVGGRSTRRLVIPHSAIFYTSDGGTWVYRSDEPLVFVREPVSVAEVADGLAVLANGEVGMTVVTVGVAELYGTETGLGAGDH